MRISTLFTFAVLASAANPFVLCEDFSASDIRNSYRSAYIRIGRDSDRDSSRNVNELLQLNATEGPDSALEQASTITSSLFSGLIETDHFAGWNPANYGYNDSIYSSHRNRFTIDLTNLKDELRQYADDEGILELTPQLEITANTIAESTVDSSNDESFVEFNSSRVRVRYYITGSRSRVSGTSGFKSYQTTSQASGDSYCDIDVYGAIEDHSGLTETTNGLGRLDGSQDCIASFSGNLLEDRILTVNLNYRSPTIYTNITTSTSALRSGRIGDATSDIQYDLDFLLPDGSSLKALLEE